MVQQKLPVIMLTGRTIEQGVSNQRGKGSKEYFDIVTTCFMDPQDMEKIGVTQGSNITVHTDTGSVVMKAAKYPRGPLLGMIYIPYSPWANVVNSEDTTTCGMPTCKGTPAEVEPTPDKPILTLLQLFELQFGKKGVICHP